MLAAQDEIEKALELYTLTIVHPSFDTVWFDDLVGQQIKQLAATLPPETASAARQRGKARDLWATTAALLSELDQA